MSVLGDQNDYTIEFEVKRPEDAKDGHGISLVSNIDKEKEAGLGGKYFPPSYNCGWLWINGHKTVEKRGFLRDKFIWIRCTPWRANQPDGTPTLDNPSNERIVKFNGITDGIMEKYGIPMVDLYAIAEKRLHTIKPGSQDVVHWGRETSGVFAEAIIKEIEKHLPKK